MELVNQLKALVLGAIPTFILVWILYAYVSRVFLGPLQRVLRKRWEATAGLRKTAESALTLAEQKTSEYEAALRLARTEIYRIQEQERQRGMDARAEIIRQSHQRADEMIQSTRQQLRGDVDAAKQSLASEAGQIATAITSAILKSSATGAGPHPAGGGEMAR